MSYFGKIVKNTLLMGSVGVLLALAAPALVSIATGIGLSQALGAGILAATGTATSAIWTGVYFGAFGGISAAIEPAISRLFGGTATQPESVSHTASYNAPSHGHMLSADIGMESKFQNMIGPERANDLSFQEKLAASRTDSASPTLH